MLSKKKMSNELVKLIEKNNKTGKLLSVVYSNGEINKGYIDKVEVDLINLKIKTTLKKEKDTKIQKKEYDITKSDRIKIRNLIKKYNFAGWADLPMGDLLALDAPSKNITFYYDNSKKEGSYLDSYTINYYSRIPKDGYKYLNELTKYMFSLIKEKKEIK